MVLRKMAKEQDLVTRRFVGKSTHLKIIFSLIAAPRELGQKVQLTRSKNGRRSNKFELSVNSIRVLQSTDLEADGRAQN